MRGLGFTIAAIHRGGRRRGATGRFLCERRNLTVGSALALGLWLAGVGPAAAADDFATTLAALENDPSDVRLGNELRRSCREHHEPGRCIDALNALVKGHPNAKAARYNAALAYVDDLPDHGLLRQGWLSTRSIEHVSTLIKSDSSDWLALYIRGLNHLHWPKWYRRTSKAVADLERCGAISEKLPAARRRRYHRLAYVALGDAHVKTGDLRKARETWRRGLAFDPAAADLAARLRLDDEDLPAFVAAARDIDKPIDTDLSFLWAEDHGRP